MTTATRCSATPCKRTTSDPSGRCHDHRGALAPASVAAVPPPTPAVEVKWKPGTVHPTGGYDGFEIEETREWIEEVYTLRGTPHREDGPALTEYRENGSCQETYIRHGLYTRPDGGPTIIEYEYGPEGTPQKEEWVEYSKLSRTDAPALLEWSEGRLYRETYIVGGKKHRLDGPAVIEHDEGREWSKEWDHPPTDHSDPDLRLEWWVNDERFTEEEFGRLREGLDSGAPLEWALSYAKGADS